MALSRSLPIDPTLPALAHTQLVKLTLEPQVHFLKGQGVGARNAGAGASSPFPACPVLGLLRTRPQVSKTHVIGGETECRRTGREGATGGKRGQWGEGGCLPASVAEAGTAVELAA